MTLEQFGFVSSADLYLKTFKKKILNHNKIKDKYTIWGFEIWFTALEWEAISMKHNEAQIQQVRFFSLRMEFVQ